MNDAVIIHAGTPKKPMQPTTTVGQMARDLGVDFRPESLQLSCVKLAREVESLRFKLALLEREWTESRTPPWRKLLRWWVRA